MAVECEAGWQPLSGPTTPPMSFTRQADGTFTRVTYEWVRADNLPPPVCGCGQSCTFNFVYGVTSEGSVGMSFAGFTGGGAGGEVTSTELAVTFEPDDFERMGYKLLLEEVVETGIRHRASGFWGQLRLALRFFLGEFPLPSMTFSAPADVDKRYVQAAWKFCRRPC